VSTRHLKCCLLRNALVLANSGYQAIESCMNGCKVSHVPVSSEYSERLARQSFETLNCGIAGPDDQFFEVLDCVLKGRMVPKAVSLTLAV